jgi:hypothetical protein
MTTLAPAPPASTLVPAVSSHGLRETDVPNDFDLMMRMAEQLADADRFLPDELAGNPGNVLAIMLRARALDIPFAVACDELYINKRGNKIGQSARLVRALARRAGHRFKTVTADAHQCILLIHLAGESKPHEVMFTMADAHQMGLTNPETNNKGGQWDKQPTNMLYARATTRAVTRHCPEVILGMGNDFLNEEMPDKKDGADIEEDDLDFIVEAKQEEHRLLVAQVLQAMVDTDYLEDGAEREEILIKLGRDYPLALNFAAPDDPDDRSVRQVMLDRLRAARIRAEKQAAGEPVDPAPPYPAEVVPGPPAGGQGGAPAAPVGDGPARARKAASGRTGARARAAEEKAAAGKEPAKKTAAKKTAKKATPPQADDTDSGEPDEAAMRALGARAFPQAAKKAAATAPAKKAATARRPVARRAPAGPVVASSAAPARKGTPPPAKAPADSSAPQGRAARPARRTISPAPDDRTMPCGCPADEVLFGEGHRKSCTLPADQRDQQ